MAELSPKHKKGTILSRNDSHYRPNKLLRFEIGTGQELIYSPISRKVRIVDSIIGQILAHWTEAKTLDDAAKSAPAASPFPGSGNKSNLQESILQGMDVPVWFRKLFYYAKRGQDEYSALQPYKVRAVLDELVEAELLVSNTVLLEKSQASTNPMTPWARISMLGVPTYNRPEDLKSCLSSFLQNARENARSIEVVIVDDSRTKAEEVSVRNILDGVKRKFGAPMWYGGLEEKNKFSSLLEGVGIPLDVIRFALFGEPNCGCSTGRNRNALLLHSVGNLILTVDDDTVCRVVAHPQFADRLKLGSEDNPMSFWIFADRKDVLNFSQPTKLDVLDAYEKLLGRSLDQVISEFSMHSDIQLSELCPHTIESLQHGNGRILLTFAGVMGDCGMYSPMPLLGQTEVDTRNRILHSRQSCNIAMRSGEILRVAQDWTVCHGLPFVGAVMGLDNRALLPPFMPVARNDEGVFGFALKKCFADAYFGHIPWALLHGGAQRGSYVCDHIDSASHLRVSDLMIMCIGAHEANGNVKDDARSLRKLGQFLVEIGSMKFPDIEEQLRIWAWQRLSHEARFWEGLLERFRYAPDFWATEIRVWLDRRYEAALKRQFVIPRDLMQDRTAQEAGELTRQLISQFGKLLLWWPDLVTTARDLRKQGKQLGSKI
ncbi:MAG: glycosyltransferase family 2 protein [Acidobacteria bacterium]|nr:MAG: glycosyltransferase family 2 protein [Acidobacteriota bacterium]